MIRHRVLCLWRQFEWLRRLKIWMTTATDEGDDSAEDGMRAYGGGD